MKDFPVSLQLPPLPTPNDIGQQLLSLKVDGVETIHERAVVLGLHEISLGQFKEGQKLEASLIYVDDSHNHNRSEALVETLTVADTVPPPKPGEFSFKVTQELLPDSGK